MGSEPRAGHARRGRDRGDAAQGADDPQRREQRVRPVFFSRAASWHDAAQLSGLHRRISRCPPNAAGLPPGRSLCRHRGLAGQSGRQGRPGAGRLAGKTGRGRGAGGAAGRKRIPVCRRQRQAARVAAFPRARRACSPACGPTRPIDRIRIGARSRSPSLFSATRHGRLAHAHPRGWARRQPGGGRPDAVGRLRFESACRDRAACRSAQGG